jgi:valyl-tRNA synthetase
MLLDQWFIDMEPLAKPAIEALKGGKITFYPDSKREQLIRYLEGLRDWNISRQIAWGIPIPAFQNINDSDDWIYDEHVDQETIEIDGKTYRRDPDVFDTWFSSSSWPYATLDFPDGADFKDFYPLSLMETGGEILYPWVSRMIMLGLYVAGDVPFKAVYIHGYVMAADGSKMSKSVGNVVAPMPIIEEFGSDALRMGIISGRSPAVNRGYDQRRVEEARNFANKLWNVARFIESQIGDDFSAKTDAKPATAADHYILSKLQQLTEVLGAHLDEYRFSEGYDALYHFVWDELADWYVEASKVDLNKGVLAHVLEATLKLVHPYAPFVTETIWQTLKWEDGLLATSHWPEAIQSDADKAADFEQVQNIVNEVRFVASSLNLSRPKLLYKANGFLDTYAPLIKSLARLESVEATEQGQGLQLTQTDHSVWLDLEQDAIKQFATNLKSKVDDLHATIKRLEGRLSQKSYVDNAPAKLVEETKSQLESAKEQHAKAQEEYKRFS